MKKLERIDPDKAWTMPEHLYIIAMAVNEIIDYINRKEEKENDTSGNN